jgi:hypothetical protein
MLHDVTNINRLLIRANIFDGKSMPFNIVKYRSIDDFIAMGCHR